MRDLTERLEFLRTRLQTTYEGLGQSSGRPYLYFVYPPEDELTMLRLITHDLMSLPGIAPIRIDVLNVTMQAIRGQEDRRQALLENPLTSDQAQRDLAGIWTRAVRRFISEQLATVTRNTRPVVVLEGLGALHPLTNPTAMMEAFAETSLDNPHTSRPVPIVLFVPGIQLPQTSRMYQFIDPKTQPLLMYRGEEC
jgi:hypothetical protein